MTPEELDKIDLTSEEKQIAEDIDNGLYDIETDEKEIARYASYAKNYLKNKHKKKKISIRVTENTLNKIKNLSLNNGINYQTYINIILNKVSDGKILVQL